MGWASIRDKIYDVGKKIEPHAWAHSELQETKTGQKIFGGVEKGVADYGGYAALVVNVVPGFGQTASLGLAAATTAAKLSIAQKNQKKAIKDEEEYQRLYAQEIAAYNSDPAAYNAALASPVSAFAPMGGEPIVPQTPQQAQQAKLASYLPVALLGAGVVAVVGFTFLLFRK